MPEAGRLFRKLRRSRAAVAGALLVALYLGSAACADLAPRGPRAIDQSLQLQAPAAVTGAGDLMAGS